MSLLSPSHLVCLATPACGFARLRLLGLVSSPDASSSFLFVISNIYRSGSTRATLSSSHFETSKTRRRMSSSSTPQKRLETSRPTASCPIRPRSTKLTPLETTETTTASSSGEIRILMTSKGLKQTSCDTLPPTSNDCVDSRLTRATLALRVSLVVALLPSRPIRFLSIGYCHTPHSARLPLIPLAPSPIRLVFFQYHVSFSMIAAHD